MHFTLRPPRFLPLFLLLPLAGCGSWSNPIDRITPHRIDVYQGNVIKQEMLDKLKPGMSPSQVRFILGTPLVVDPFRKNRWDYVYRHEQGGKVLEQRRVTVVFEDDKLKSLEGDIVPAGPRAQGGPAAAEPPGPAAKPEGDRK
jgi:outer membrane protein assembly factor BamE